MKAKVERVLVCLGEKLVGTLAETANHRVAFEYSPEWLEMGFPISPFSLPLESRVFVPEKLTFDGLFGVFADSLPDSWGQLLVDRLLQRQGYDPEEVSPLQRLCIVGDAGMGALCYRPAWTLAGQSSLSDLDEMAEACRAILNQEETDELDKLFIMGGSSGGARPKVVTDEWIIKFPATRERPDSGLMEKAYMDCAEACGIIVPETQIRPSRRCAGYFATKRFDRIRKTDGTLQRRHMLTAAAILEVDWRTPSLDYHTLMKLTKIICRDNPEDVWQLYLRMCFNVFSHNRDDHAKNFSFLYDDAKDLWHLSPAYDLTWSSTYFGEHTTTVDGNGSNPDMRELVNVGTRAGLSKKKCIELAERVQEQTGELVRIWGNRQME